MRTELVFPSAVAFFRLLPSVCPWYGIAKPSVWSRRRRGKLCPFNNFHSDYPLNLSSFWPDSRAISEKLYIRPFLLLPSESLSSRAVCHCRLLCQSRIVGCSSKDSRSTSLIRKAVARSLASEYPEQRPLVPHLGVIAGNSGTSNPPLINSAIRNNPMQDGANFSAVAASECRLFGAPP
jgi:hypothetical protein